MAMTDKNESQRGVGDAVDGCRCDHTGRMDDVLPDEEPIGAQAALFRVVSPALTLALSEGGDIVRPIIGKTELFGCRQVGTVSARNLAGGGREFTRTVADAQQRQTTLTNRFMPQKDSIRWEIDIVSEGAPWSTPIESCLSYPVTTASRFWTTWGHPDERGAGWADPLEWRPFSSRAWDYQYGTFGDVLSGPETRRECISMPIFSVSEPDQDQALTLVQSPEDTLLDLTLATTSDGGIRLSRRNHRLGGGRLVRFAMDIVAHPADARAGLGWMAKRYPQFFDPGIPLADELSGCTAYSGNEEPFDAERMRRMAFAYNWKCSEDFPYMGQFLPPLLDAEARWMRAPDESTPGKPAWTGFQILNDYSRWMRANGFRVLNYYNVTEYGRNMTFPPPPRQAPIDGDLWLDPHDYLFHGGLASAVLMDGEQPWRSNCYGALIVDPGDPGYQQHLLQQALRHVRMVPDSDGICIDRTDWLNQYNPNADDGISWVNGKPARSLFVSWKELMSKLAACLHKAGKVVFVNNCSPRIDIVGLADGIYAEWGSDAWGMQTYINYSALAGVRKPVAIWTVNDSELTDDYMQRCLYLGIFPTAPYPNNNHCLRPSQRADEQFLAYGPLLNAMRARKWVLEPHCIVSTSGRSNLFSVPGGYVAPVTHAGEADNVTTRIRSISGVDQLSCDALHPGAEQPVPLSGKIKDGVIELSVPLVRGCAMIRLKWNVTA